MPRRIGDVILEVEDLHTYCFTRWGVVKAVDGVSLSLRQGEALGIVGESGCGKTMTALSLLRLVPRPAARIVKGAIRLAGENLLEKSEKQMRTIRGRRISMILQDPHTSLNPVFTVGNQLIEAIKIHHRDGRRGLAQRAIDSLKQVRVAAPERRVQDYPHQISGGMKQRVVGAIAISSEPRVIIADEPTTSLDATIQAQYLKLLREIQEETNLALIFITHDFGIVAKMCDRVMVMYAGRVVEDGPVRDIFNRPAHPYTQALLRSVPSMDEDVERLASITGQPPALWDLPPGCRFAARCPHADDRCHRDYPPQFVVGDEQLRRLLETGSRMPAEPILRADGLTKHFAVTQGVLWASVVGWVKAVDGISFSIRQGETLAIVGESGCGKTTTARLVLRLEQPTAGRVFVDGRDVHALSGDALKEYRTMVQAVFQDPWSSLHPRMRVRELVAEPLVVNRTASSHEIRTRVAEILNAVACAPGRPTSIRTSSAAVSASASPWPARWCRTPS